MGILVKLPQIYKNTITFNFQKAETWFSHSTTPNSSFYQVSSFFLHLGWVTCEKITDFEKKMKFLFWKFLYPFFYGVIMQVLHSQIEHTSDRDSIDP